MTIKDMRVSKENIDYCMKTLAIAKNNKGNSQ